MIGIVNTTREAVQDPQLLENGYIVDFKHPDMGNIRIPGFPIQFSNAELNKNFLGSRLGGHTEAVLKSVGKYSESEIAGFRKEKLI